MNCIDAVEGSVKTIITFFEQQFLGPGKDDTEYIRNVRMAIDATERFILDHPDIFPEPQVVKGVLYTFAKTRWMEHMDRIRENTADSEPDAVEAPVDADEYDSYYFDYLYENGVPPR